jgi:SAM-dependent methyltransferase
MQGLLESAIANPWETLRTVLDGPLHPGGTEATDALLDRAEVTPETRLLDVGCGAGEAVGLARARDAEAFGVDRDPATDAATRATSVRGDLTALPVREGSVDVVLAECVLCLVPDRQRALTEARRVLKPGGRLALSDIVVEGDLPSLPEPVVRALCLERSRSRTEMVTAVEDAGFAVEDVRDHREALLAMREQVKDRVDYERLLPLLGDRGVDLLDGVEELETATEEGRVSYVSLVARRGT